MTTSKPALSSQTIIASQMVIFAGLCAALGYPIGDDITNNLITIGGAVWAIYGRLQATQPISGIIR
jgi:hypothetical protein